MGIRRYSRWNEAWEREVDHLQMRCHSYDDSPTIGQLLDHGIPRGQWRCRNVGWKSDGKPQCWHKSEEFELTAFGRNITVSKLRWKYVCSACGRDRPFLELWVD